MNFEAFKRKYQRTEVEQFPNQVSKKVKVSVLVQTYNHERYIKDCLEGILEQKTNFGYEILLGEDRSTDSTREICKQFAASYPDKIKLFLHHLENKIKVMNFTTGNFNSLYNLFCAKGKYILFCEGDDIWKDPLKLQKQVNFLEENPAFVLSYHSYKAINDLGEEIQTDHVKMQPEKDLSSEDLYKLTHHPLLLCTCFRNVIEDIPDEMSEVINVDTFLFSVLGRYGKGKFLKDIKPALYRQHPGGIWSRRDKQRKFLSKIHTYKKIARFYEANRDKELSKFYIEKVRNNYKMLILQYVKAGKIRSAIIATSKFISTHKLP